MAAYTVNTTAGQETTLDYMLPIVNAKRVAAGQGTITKPQLVQGAFNEKVADLREQALADQKAPIVPALDNATPSQITQIKTILGI